jgi:hypothetical protein
MAFAGVQNAVHAGQVCAQIVVDPLNLCILGPVEGAEGNIRQGESALSVRALGGKASKIIFEAGKLLPPAL